MKQEQAYYHSCMWITPPDCEQFPHSKYLLSGQEGSSRAGCVSAFSIYYPLSDHLVQWDERTVYMCLRNCMVLFSSWRQVGITLKSSWTFCALASLEMWVRQGATLCQAASAWGGWDGAFGGAGAGRPPKAMRMVTQNGSCLTAPMVEKSTASGRAYPCACA